MELGQIIALMLMLFVPWIYFAIKYHSMIKDWKKHEHLKTRVYWNDHRTRIEKSGICPCCGHTFHHLVESGERRRIFMPSGVYDTVTKLLEMSAPYSEDIAICVIMAALDADKKIARSIVLCWDQIESVQ